MKTSTKLKMELAKTCAEILTAVSLAACLITVAVISVRTMRTVQTVAAHVTATVDALPDLATSQIAMARGELMSRLDTGIGAAQHEIRATRGEATRQMALTRLMATQELDAFRESFDMAAVESLKLAHYHATEFEDRLDTSNLILAKTAGPIANTAVQIAEVAPLFLDCDHNENCLFNRYVGTARGIEQAAEAVGRAAPTLAADTELITNHVAHIAGDVQRFADKAVEPKTKKRIALEVLISTGMIGARIF
jgi:hypothetical protein